MAKIHVLSGGENIYQCVAHDATPVGNNSAGVPWSAVVVSAGLAHTMLPEGAGPGQITTAEKLQVESGDVLEVSFTFQDDPSLTPAQRLAYLDQMGARAIAEMQSRLAKSLKFFGLTR